MILAGTDDGIYRWFEGGPWLTFHSLQGRAIIDIASAGPGVLAALDDAGRIWETETNGQEWRTIPLPPSAGKATAIAIGGSSPSIILATRPFGLYLRPLGAPLPHRPGPLESLLERAGGGLALVSKQKASKTQDLGWVRLGIPPLAANSPVALTFRALARGSGSADPWYASVAGASLWRSIDGGQSWTQCPGLPAEIHAIRPFPGQAGVVGAATSDGFWITRDAGQSWADSSAGLESARHLRALDIRPDDSKHLLAGAAPAAPGAANAASSDGLGFALYESKDGGKSWSHVTRNFPIRLQYDTIDDIRWDPAGAGYAIIALGSGECWRTRSEGAWWEPLARQTRLSRVLCAVG